MQILPLETQEVIQETFGISTEKKLKVILYQFLKNGGFPITITIFHLKHYLV